MMSSEHDGPRSDRRGHPRYKAQFAVGIDGNEKKGRLGVAQDASAHGVLVNTCSRFAPEDEVTLTIHAIPGGAQVRARLVRIQEVARESPYPWRYLAAAEFVEPLPELEAVIADAPRA
jgi:hypothetical protein